MAAEHFVEPPALGDDLVRLQGAGARPRADLGQDLRPVLRHGQEDGVRAVLARDLDFADAVDGGERRAGGVPARRGMAKSELLALS